MTIKTRGHSMRYIQLAARTNTYLHSFFQSTIRLWNSVPEEIALFPNFDCFKLLAAVRYLSRLDNL